MAGPSKELERQPLYRFIAPRYWGLWFLIAILRASCWLPYPLQMRIGRGLGRLMHRSLRTRRLIALRNIELCFPDLDADRHDEMVRRHFESLGACLVEMALGWWGSERKLDKLMKVEGIEHLQAVLANGKGAILVTAHFTSIEASGRVFRKVAPPFRAMYRPNKNPLINELLRRGREKTAESVIAKNDVKTMLRTLKNNTPVLYAPDQSYNRKWSEIVPFFSIPAMSNVATSRISKMTGAAVLPYLPLRLPGDRGYLLSILPPIENFPSDDPIADTLKYHEIVEEHVRKDPSQYWWVHRRFKGRPDSFPDVYENLEERAR